MTTEIIYKCEEILKELYRFSDDIIYLGNAITDNRLEEFEAQIGYNFPIDFKYILKRHNSFSLLGTEVMGFDLKYRGSSLDQLYYFEHQQVDNPMFKEFLPFSPDGRGNHYCLDLSKLENGLCPVVFWQHDYFYLDKTDVEISNNTFIDWIKEVMINWTLEDTNYDGNEK